MRTSFCRNIILVIIVYAVILSAAGCGKHTASDNRVSRLTADENYRLKDQIDQLNKQIAVLTKDIEQAKQQQAAPAAAEKQQNAALAQENQQLRNSLSEAAANAKNLTDQLEQCQKEFASPTDERVKKMAEEVAKAKKEAEESVNFVMTTVREEGEKETKTLRDENETLKAQVQKLQDELKQLKK
jgi:chromosome segregation ATPase